MGTSLQIQLKNELEAVSIQLVSPASGDILSASGSMKITPVSIQLVSPASGDKGNTIKSILKGNIPFPFN